MFSHVTYNLQRSNTKHHLQHQTPPETSIYTPVWYKNPDDSLSILKPILPRFPTMPESNAFIHCKEQNGTATSVVTLFLKKIEEKELSHTRVQWGWGALVKNLTRVETIWREVLPFPHPVAVPTQQSSLTKGHFLCAWAYHYVWWNLYRYDGYQWL